MVLRLFSKALKTMLLSRMTFILQEETVVYYLPTSFY